MNAWAFGPRPLHAWIPPLPFPTSKSGVPPGPRERSARQRPGIRSDNEDYRCPR